MSTKLTSGALALLVCAAAVVLHSQPAWASEPASEQTVDAGPIRATLKLDRSSINVAQSVVATLIVHAPAGVRVSLPLAEPRLGGFTVVSSVDEPPRTVVAKAGEEQVLVRRYTLAPFLAGEYRLPPLEIRWQKSAGESGVARTAEVAIRVESLLGSHDAKGGQSLDPGTIREAYTIPVPRERWGLWEGVGIGVGVSALACFGIWMLTRRRSGPDEITRLLATAEQARAGIEAGGSDPMHLLAGVLRSGLAERLEPCAATAETSELVERLRRNPVWGEEKATGVGEVLRALDAARFGGEAMPPAELRRHAETVIAVLLNLRSMPVSVRPTRSSGVKA